MKVALAGNPNCGKTTLFNILTGSNQYVGNWPGVTVEKKEGKLKGREDVIITDLPGIYSLSPYTLEEVVTRKYLIDEEPDAILDVVDGTNPERNLYLTTQLVEIGIPVIIAVNMIDLVHKNGDVIDLEELKRKFGCEVIAVSALKSDGVELAVQTAIDAVNNKVRTIPRHNFSGPVEHALAHIEERVLHDVPEDKQRWYAIKLFERDAKVIEKLAVSKENLDHIELDIKAAEEELGDDSEAIIANERYVYIGEALKTCYKRHRGDGLSVSDKIDRVLTNRWAALPIAALIMFGVYYISVTTVGAWATKWATEGLFGDGWSMFGLWIPGIPAIVGGLLGSNCPEWLYGLVINGIIGGVGSVVGFIPQLLVLFFLLAFLESCGYMSRVAFVLDRVFRKFGLSGKSFIPLLVASGCGVPGIMASRTIENERDRRMTIITTTFIPCGAKIPIIALLSSAIFGNAWWVGPSAYFMGVCSVVLSGFILKKTKPFEGKASPFVMELPNYHWPTMTSLLRSTWDRGSGFIKKAGSVILLASVLIWAGSVFGMVSDGTFGFDTGMLLENSVLGIFGRAIDVVFLPLGFGTIRASIATVMGLLAKEEVVAVFGVLDFEKMSGAAGFSFLCFNLLCAPCIAAISAIRSEMKSTRWTLFAIAYQTVFAYCVSLMIYQFGRIFEGNISVSGFICAMVVLAFMLFMVFRPVRRDQGGV